MWIIFFSVQISSAVLYRGQNLFSSTVQISSAVLYRGRVLGRNCDKGPKVLRVFLLAIYSHLYSHLYKRILLPPPLEQKWFETGCNVNIVYGNLKSENSQDYAQKPQRNCAFMNSASGGSLSQNKNRKDCGPLSTVYY